VQIEVNETATFLDVLLAHVPEQVTLAAAGFAKHDYMSHPILARERYVAFRCLVIDYAKTQIQTSTLKPCSASPSAQAVPNGCDELSKKANHHDSIVRGGPTKTVTNGGDLSDK